MFNVSISPDLPSPLTNKVPSVTVYENYYTEVPIPSNLFYGLNNFSDLYSTNCIDNNNVKVVTRISKDMNTNEYLLFVKVYGSIGWNITVVDRNSYWQSSESIISINVVGWSSKEWDQCKGPTDSDWLQCKQGYVLDSSGSCLVDINFLPYANSRLFWIWGIIAMITWFIQIILSFRYDKDTFEIVSNLQSVIMLTLSFDSVSTSWIEYLSWIQIFKFDYGFINPLIYNNSACTRSPEKLTNAKLFWQDVFHNYFVILWFAKIMLCFNIVLYWSRKFRYILNSNIFNKMKTNLISMFLDLISPFLIINIYIDLINIKNHVMYTLYTILMLMIWIVYLIKTKFYFLRYEYVSKVDPYKNSKYFYLQIILKTTCILIFLSNSRLISSLLMILILVIQSSLLSILIMYKVKLPLQKTFDKATMIFCNWIILLVYMLIAVAKVSFYIFKI